MAKSKSTTTAAVDETAVPAVEDQDATLGVVDGVDTESNDQDDALGGDALDLASDLNTDPENGGEQRATVPALVLHNSYLGKVGEKVEVPADQAQALKDAGYIDTHVAALKYEG